MENDENEAGKLIFLMGVIFMIFLGFWIGSQILTAFQNEGNWYNLEKSTTTDIYSLHMGNTMEGKFILGSGTMRGDMVYTYFYDAGGGGLILGKVPTDRTIIYRDTNDQPYLKTTNLVQKNSKREMEITAYDAGYPKYELHVPNNTINEEFKV